LTGLSLVERLARPHDEGDAIPPFVPNLEHRGAEGWGGRIVWHRGIVAVPAAAGKPTHNHTTRLVVRQLDDATTKSWQPDGSRLVVPAETCRSHEPANGEHALRQLETELTTSVARTELMTSVARAEQKNSTKQKRKKQHNTET
jgi:hypothetical protein